MNKNEFALFNYYRGRFSNAPEAEKAVDRFWRSFGEVQKDADV